MLTTDPLKVGERGAGWVFVKYVCYANRDVFLELVKSIQLAAKG